MPLPEKGINRLAATRHDPPERSSMHPHQKLSPRDDFPYRDILYLPHPVSAVHPPMSVSDRAAQFAPFAALTDYHSSVREMARFTDKRIELDENAKSALDEKLRLLQQRLPLHPQVTILYFLPDTRKEGGSYIQVSGSVKKIDRYSRRILLENGIAVSMDDITDITDLE